MKLLLPGALIFVLTFSASAQNIDYNKVVLPEKVNPTEFQERLVQLAWRNHPSNKVLAQNVLVAEKEKTKAGWSWLDDIYANGNLNEFTINPDPGNTANLFYPKYNFGIRISLGTFVRVPIETKIANDQLINAQHLVNEKKITVRQDVLTNLEKYKQYFAFRKFRRQAKDDAYIIFTDAEKKFNAGDIEFEQYQRISQAYYSQSEDVLEAEANLNTAGIALEALIGVRLMDVEGYNEFIKQLDDSIVLD